MFDVYHPTKKELFQIMDNEGKVINKEWFPKIDDSTLLKAYKELVFARAADLMIVSYQRQGRIYTYPPGYGQEAVSEAVAVQMKKEDWVVPAFRELPLYLAKGASLKDVFKFYMGDEKGAGWSNAKNMLPISVPIATQLPHAVGLGYSLKYNKKDNVVYAFVGDGGTSTGDFHEAMNFAAVWKVPVVFIVQNNQFAISVPFETQTGTDTIAIKSVAYGMPGLRVDGNDFFAMYKAIEQASEHARSGKGAVLIEAVTYRRGAHTTSDDPYKYRTKEEEELWEKKDPVKRLKAYLITNKLWTEEEDDRHIKACKKEVDKLFIETEQELSYELDEVFDHLYSELPDDLEKQKARYKAFLEWKAKRK
ncbi:pyruvate dehydrogenase (acetyl-transferring) E1 component subunit alpha [Prolixibacteraceae bacterium JC049]|nr:pyruvate dehydrogenase (acetyl-transferring) E1 component subunit alpha [Prolixibacteraceae bacterium JC049]